MSAIGAKSTRPALRDKTPDYAERAAGCVLLPAGRLDSAHELWQRTMIAILGCVTRWSSMSAAAPPISATWRKTHQLEIAMHPYLTFSAVTLTLCSVSFAQAQVTIDATKIRVGSLTHKSSRII